jgi:hypothetical protein
MFDFDRMRKLPLDELFNHMGTCQPGSVQHGTYEAEIARRKAVKDEKVAEAQISAARWTKRSAIVAAASLVITAAGLLLAHRGCV